ncbi:redoxin domain-containing protein [Halorarius litoreus]|uniref:redoxin domain-containing protein n=1 Tax=Halorarius litoreus TaxID=2962676 RepID=UPI0020CCA77C|nr:redoxin domain-containing protein [Halorarius litoreus]
MVDVGDDAPEFTAPLATGDLEEFTLSERLDDGPVVLAFFPGAFTSVCTGEMRTFRDRFDNFTGEATLYAVSTDSPFSLNEFRAQNDLPFDLISDVSGEVTQAYGVSLDLATLGVPGVDEGDVAIAERAVFVVDTDGQVTYAWVGDNPGVEPDYEEVESAATEA